MPFDSELGRNVRYLKGIGPFRSQKLGRIGIETIEDVLYTFPRRYEDRRHLTRLRDLVYGKVSSVVARVVSSSSYETRKKGLTVTEVVITDGEDLGSAVWFNRKGLERIFLAGVTVAFYGKIGSRYGKPQLTNPDFEVIDNDGQLSEFSRIVPVYPTTDGLYQKWLRKFIRYCLDFFLEKVEEFLPQKVVSENDLMPIRKAIMEMHYPSGRNSWSKARKRLAFDEFFILQSGLAMRKRAGEETSEKAPRFHGVPPEEALRIFPFSLTDAQTRVMGEISSDLSKDIPMHRLIQGDVGSGKTVIAVLSMLDAARSGYQAVFMAPTEILAQQHFQKLSGYFGSLGFEPAFLSGSVSGRERKIRIESIKNGKTRIIIGTHALFQEGVEYDNLGLVVIDEQHRFGVLQRGALRKKGRNPHVLVMTATPIPRTLTLSIYGDLSVSVIDEMPPGRKDVITGWIRPSRIGYLKKLIFKQVKTGRQVYWVCPLIEESDHIDAASLNERYEKLCETMKGLKIGFMHGHLSASEKNSVMEDFIEGNLDILVSTTVIEVGVDVPNATVMVIEDADRFGLSQLHQLRGRVGRGGAQSYCLLLADPSTAEAKERLEILCRNNDGFLIAEADLHLRGPGEVCGIRQHGVTDFRVADLIKDRKILESARQQAFCIVGSDRELMGFPLLRREVLSRVGKVLELVETG